MAMKIYKDFKGKNQDILGDSNTEEKKAICQATRDENIESGEVKARVARFIVKKKKPFKKKDGVKESKSIKYKPKKIEKRDDVNPKAGVKEYGDVKFADPVNRKYPIDNSQHVKSAWSYINQEKNAAKYSAKEVELIKSRIVRQWKKLIDENGPPSIQEKVSK